MRTQRLLLHLVVGGIVMLCSGPCSWATMSVFDAALNGLEQVNWSLDHTMKSTFHTADIAKYVEQINNQVRQIVNEFTQIANQVEGLRRLGDPNYYVHMLSLDTLLGEVRRVEGTIGGTMSEFRGLANGLASLRYTGDGLYSDLTQWKSLGGQPINYNQDSFKKYGMVFDLYDAYDREMQRYQGSMTNLQNDFASTLEQLNNESTQIGRETLAAKLNAIATQMDVAMKRLQIAADRVKVQQQVNAADQARMQEAVRQMELSNMALQNEATIEAGAKSQSSFPSVSNLGPLNLGW
jgi:predicted phage tail protein